MPSRSAEKGSATGRRDVADTVPGAQEAVAERGLVAADDSGRNHPGADHLEGHSHGVVGGGAGGGDGQHGPGDAEINGDLADAGGGHRSGHGKGVDAGVAGVELGRFGLDGGAASVAAAEDDGDIAGVIMLRDLAFERSLAGGYDGKLGSTVCRRATPELRCWAGSKSGTVAA